MSTTLLYFAVMSLFAIETLPKLSAAADKLSTVPTKDAKTKEQAPTPNTTKRRRDDVMSRYGTFIYFPQPLGQVNLTETCPDECIYTEECGKLVPLYETDNFTTNETVSYMAGGNGVCFGSLGMNDKICPIKTENECILKCGFEICAYKDNIYASLDNYWLMPKVYQILNDSSIDYESYDITWYNDYKKKNDPNGTIYPDVS